MQYKIRPVYPIFVKNKDDKIAIEYIIIVEMTTATYDLKYFVTSALINSAAALKLTKLNTEGLITYLQHIDIPKNETTNAANSRITLLITSIKLNFKYIRLVIKKVK